MHVIATLTSIRKIIMIITDYKQMPQNVNMVNVNMT